jgi:hypothetical protein
MNRAPEGGWDAVAEADGSAASRAAPDKGVTLPSEEEPSSGCTCEPATSMHAGFAIAPLALALAGFALTRRARKRRRG